MTGQLSPGTTVSWESQSYGVWKPKSGTVLCYLPPGVDAFAVYPELQRVARSRIKFKRASQIPRYLVEVHRGGMSTLTDYYAPAASWLEQRQPETAGGERS